MKKEKYKYNETDKQIKIISRITDEVLNRLAKDYKVNKGQINFAGIGKFSTYPRYVTNTGRLKYRKEDWKKIIDKL